MKTGISKNFLFIRISYVRIIGMNNDFVDGWRKESSLPARVAKNFIMDAAYLVDYLVASGFINEENRSDYNIVEIAKMIQLEAYQGL